MSKSYIKETIGKVAPKMRTARNLNNPLIASFLDNKAVGQPGLAPMPNDYADFDDFIVSHRDYLQSEHMLNTTETHKLLLQAKNTSDSSLLSYLSGIIGQRKEYSAFLMDGILGCNKVLKGDSRGGNRKAEF